MPQISMDVFKQDAFSARNLTAAIDKEGFVPTMLGSIPGLFVPPPLGQPHTKAIFIEERTNEPSIIQTSPRGSEPDNGRSDEESRKVRPFVIPRLAKRRRITAAEIAGIRAFGQLTELMSLESKVARLQYLMQRDISLTWEHMRLGAIQGATLDADGSTIYDWSTEFAQSLASDETWTFSPSSADGSIRAHCASTVRGMLRSLKSQGGIGDASGQVGGVRVYGLAGDDFWDQLIAAKETRETYQFAMQAQQLREAAFWQQFSYGGITFVNYRGTDDNSSVAIEPDHCKFVPAGAGIFQQVYAPADERFEFIDTPGQEAYSWLVTDPLRNAWVDVEMYSYPLFMCVMPQALRTGVTSTT